MLETLPSARKRLYQIAATMMVVLMLMACTSKTPAPVINYGIDVKKNAGVHNVREGDTLYSIAERYRLSIEDLIVLYDTDLKAGDRLILPPPRSYQVKKGDTLYTIAQAFGLDYQDVAQANALDKPYKLSPGQVLQMPGRDIQIVSTPSAKPEQSIPAIPKQTVRKADLPASSGRFGWPARGKILSEFGPKPGGFHNDGINIAGNRGDPVAAAEHGVIAYTGDQIEGLGNLILIKHENGYMSAYAHLDQVEVARGQMVRKGDVIGKIGSSGNVSQPQLHFEIRKGTKALDPRRYL